MNDKAPAGAARSDIEIARAARLRDITEISGALGIPEEAVYRFGPHKAKIALDYIDTLAGRPDGKLILTTGMTPTPAGEGKTTTTVGLGDALNHVGRKAAICLREPSLGPCFGVKGGAAGGGYAQVVPMEDINLHFTGDFHAIGSAHNLLAALLDNHIYWGNALNIDARRIFWRRVVDLNDRALRTIVGSLGGVANGFPREDGFDITVASEVMAVFCLAENLADLKDRLGAIIVAETRDRAPVFARDLMAPGPMAALLKDSILPNLVQTLEKTPAFVHGGPFANIAHGCNSVTATRTALKLADYVVTEAGFGADLGGEKFIDIKCRKAGLVPDVAVLVGTIRAIKMHGGVARLDLGAENVAAVARGVTNLMRHVAILQGFGVPVVVALNRFVADTDAEIAVVAEACAARGVDAVECNHWSLGGPGAVALAEKVVAAAETPKDGFRFLYPDDMTLWDKIETIARKVYGAGLVSAPERVKRQIQAYQDGGYGTLPVCMAKTPLSLSGDPTLLGAPENHELAVREVRLANGAGFLIAICGDIMTMPGLPRVPAANAITVNERGEIEGLF